MMGCFRTVASFAVGRDRGKKLNAFFPAGARAANCSCSMRKHYIAELIAAARSEPWKGVSSATKRFSFLPPSVFS